MVAENDDVRNALVDKLRNTDSHFNVFAGATLAAALDEAKRAPAIDLVVVPDGGDVQRVAELARSDFRLTGVPVLVTATGGNLSGVKSRLLSGEMKGYEAVDEKADAAAINTAVQQARAAVGSVPVSGLKIPPIMPPPHWTSCPRWQATTRASIPSMKPCPH